MDAILEAGTYAVGGMGGQSAVMVAVQDKAVIAKIGRLNTAVIGAPNARPFYGATTNVLVDKTTCTPVENGSLVIGNVPNTAQASSRPSVRLETFLTLPSIRDVAACSTSIRRSRPFSAPDAELRLSARTHTHRAALRR